MVYKVSVITLVAEGTVVSLYVSVAISSIISKSKQAKTHKHGNLRQKVVMPHLCSTSSRTLV